VFDPATRVYTYPCPCGDKFTITEVPSRVVFSFMVSCGAQEELFDGEDVARCPSCSLIVRVIYDPVKKTCFFFFFAKCCVFSDSRHCTGRFRTTT